MTAQKISAIAGAALLAGGLWAGAVAQAQPGPHYDRRPPVHQARRLPPMAVGHRVPNSYRGHSYRVDNWQRYHLQRPRRGQYWVRYNAQFLLVNSAGIVLQVFVP